MKKFNLNNDPKITSGFTTPEDYFDSFPDKVLERLPKQKSNVISIFGYRKTWYFASAAILILMLSIGLYTKYLTQKQEEVDSIALENYLACQPGICEEEIINLLQQQDLDKIKLDFHIDEETLEDALNSNSNLEQYLTN